MNIRAVGLDEFFEIANDERVFKHVQPFLPSPHNEAVTRAYFWNKPNAAIIGVEGVRGALVFVPRLPGFYEMHYFMPERGGLRAARGIIEWLFTNTDVRAIVGATPRSNLAARLASRWLGGVPVSTVIDDVSGQPCIVYALTREQWADHFLRLGRTFTTQAAFSQDREMRGNQPET